MQFTEIIQKVNKDQRLVPDLMKSEKGNNFRAISESAILDVIDPILSEAHWWYDVRVQKSDLQIREAYGSKGKKLQFIATVEIKLVFHYDDPDYDHYYDDRIATEAVGMGIDDNDKAMGKAYTYAVKYALLKVFRLRYSDDPDFKASEPLLVDKSKEAIKEEPKKEEKKPKAVQKPAKEQAMTEAQRDYILGLMEEKDVTAQTMMEKFEGCDPVVDEFIPMKTARAMIKWLTEKDLPF